MIVKDRVYWQPKVESNKQTNFQPNVEAEVPAQGSIPQPEAEQSSQPQVKTPSCGLRLILVTRKFPAAKVEISTAGCCIYYALMLHLNVELSTINTMADQILFISHFYYTFMTLGGQVYFSFTHKHIYNPFARVLRYHCYHWHELTPPHHHSPFILSYTIRTWYPFNIINPKRPRNLCQFRTIAQVLEKVFGHNFPVC